jgi:hypothetical protein
VWIVGRIAVFVASQWERGRRKKGDGGRDARSGRHVLVSGGRRARSCALRNGLTYAFIYSLLYVFWGA